MYVQVTSEGVNDLVRLYVHVEVDVLAIIRNRYIELWEGHTGLFRFSHKERVGREDQGFIFFQWLKVSRIWVRDQVCAGTQLAKSSSARTK